MNSFAILPLIPGAFWLMPSNPVTGVATKPVEHSNEYGINLGGPLVPFGAWKQKLFYYGNYNGFRYTSAQPHADDLSHVCSTARHFTGLPAIYDPLSEASCAAHRPAAFLPLSVWLCPPAAGVTGAQGAPVLTGTANEIPASMRSPLCHENAGLSADRYQYSAAKQLRCAECHGSRELVDDRPHRLRHQSQRHARPRGSHWPSGHSYRFRRMQDAT